MPKQKPRRSEQTVCTPREFLSAVEERFGVIDWDLAASADNAVTGKYLGPGAPRGADSLAVDWAMLPTPPYQCLWLNPPFGNIAKFAAKCAEQAPAIAGSILMLVPASVGTNWFAQHVHRKALVLALRPRLTFVGHEDPYPKDLMLAIYGRWVVPAFDTWRWDSGEECPF
jgi:phage N-6-adenine-methyltransferase